MNALFAQSQYSAYTDLKKGNVVGYRRRVQNSRSSAMNEYVSYQLIRNILAAYDFKRIGDPRAIPEFCDCWRKAFENLGNRATLNL